MSELITHLFHIRLVLDRLHRVEVRLQLILKHHALLLLLLLLSDEHLLLRHGVHGHHLFLAHIASRLLPAFSSPPYIASAPPVRMWSRKLVSGLTPRPYASFGPHAPLVNAFFINNKYHPQHSLISLSKSHRPSSLLKPDAPPTPLSQGLSCERAVSSAHV